MANGDRRNDLRLAHGGRAPRESLRRRAKLSRMRRLWGLAGCLVLLASGATSLRSLLDQGRMFQLRRTLSQRASSDPQSAFYRAVVAARFGQETAVIADLRQFLATHPQPVDARKANG